MKCIASRIMLCIVGIVAFACAPLKGFTQHNIIVNLSTLDGMELSPDNILNFQIINNGGSENLLVKGTLRYRNSTLKFGYEFTTRVNNGANMFSADKVLSPIWSFSEPALRELFFDYKKLPQGTYEYCVEVQVRKENSESPDVLPVSDCIYQKVNDIFLINLIDPDNDAKLYEQYPMLSWVVNYPFASELKYRVRVAELKPGQSNENAITRNNPVFQDNTVFSTSMTYPVTAKPLITFQPYVWTVDAYFKGILLGGAEVWKFTITEDSLLQAIPKDPAYVEINEEDGNQLLYAVGKLKLKYVEEEKRYNTLRLVLTDEKGTDIKIPDTTWNVTRGDNRKIIQFYEERDLKHLKSYKLTITSDNGNEYAVTFKYVNPLYLKN